MCSRSNYAGVGVQKGILMLKSRGLRAMAVVAQAVLCISGPLCAQTSQKIESVLIERSKPYTKVVSDIQALGGRVKQQYQYVDAVAAEVPSNAMGTLRAQTPCRR